MKKLISSLFLSSAMAGSLFAATVVDFSTVDGINETEFGQQSDVDLSTPLIESDDFNTAPDSPTVFGGTNNPDRHQFFERDLGAGGSTITVLDVGPAAARSYTAAYLWQKDDFLNGGDSQQVNIDSSSNFSATWATNGGFDRAPTGHWAVLQDGDIYVSNESYESNVGDELQTFNSGDLTAMSWSTVDLETSMTADPITGTLDFDDIDGVGIYFTSDFASGGAGGVDEAARGIHFEGFSADVAVIPEPSAFALFAGALGLGLVALRRRRRA